MSRPCSGRTRGAKTDTAPEEVISQPLTNHSRVRREATTATIMNDRPTSASSTGTERRGRRKRVLAKTDRRTSKTTSTITIPSGTGHLRVRSRWKSQPSLKHSIPSMQILLRTRWLATATCDQLSTSRTSRSDRSNSKKKSPSTSKV